MALTLNRLRSSAPGETAREEEKRTGRDRLAAAMGATDNEPEEKEERKTGRDRLAAAIERAEAPETPSAVPASPAEPAAQQGRIRPGWDTADAARANEEAERESHPFISAVNDAVGAINRAKDAAGADADTLRDDLTRTKAERDAANTALQEIIDPWNRANTAAQTYRSQVQAYETKLGMLNDTIANSTDPEERRRAQQESNALNLYYQKAKRAAERYGSRFNELNSQFQQLAIQRNRAEKGLQAGMEQYTTLLSLGDKRAAKLEKEAEELRKEADRLYRSGQANAPTLRLAEQAEAKAAQERQNYAEYLYGTKGEGAANRYLAGEEAGNRMKAEQASFAQKVLNTVGGTALNFFSGIAGSPWIMMARLMELPDDALYAITGDERFNLDAPGKGPRTSQIFQNNDPFRQEAQGMKQRAGSLGSSIIDTGYAAGNMMSMSSIASAGISAMGGAGLASELEGIANSSKLLTSPEARIGARMALDILKNPGNIGVSVSSGINSYSEALANGASFGQALANGIMKGAVEYFSNKLFAGMPLENAPGEKGYVTKAAEFVAEKLGKSEALEAFNKTTGGKVLGWIYDKAGEGLEEVISGIFDPVVDLITYDKEADWIPKLDALTDEFIGGVMLSLLMSGGEAVLRPTMTRAQIAEDLVRQGVPKAEARKYAGMIYKDMKAAERAQKAVQEAVETQEAGITEAQEAENENTPPVPGAVQENGPPVPQVVQNAPQAEQTAENAPPVPGEVRNAAETAGTVQETETVPQEAAENRTETAESPTGRARLEAAMASERHAAGEATPRTEGLRLPTARETLAPAPERVNLLANNRTEGTNNGTAAAENTGADLSDRNERRGYGLRAGEQAGQVGRSPEGWRTLSRPEKAAARRAYADDVGVQPVQAKSLGVTAAAEDSTVRVYPREAWEPDLQRIAGKVEKATGKPVTFVLGAMKVNAGGVALTVRGVNTGKGIIVQADDPSISAEKIATHEAFHAFAAQDPELSAKVLKQIRHQFPENRLREIAGTYLDKLYGIVDLDSTDKSVISKALGRVRDEICADAYAGINAFSANADEYTGAARQVVTEARREAAAATERKTGPPESYSASDSDAAYIRYSADYDQEATEARIREAQAELERITPSQAERNDLLATSMKDLRAIDKRRRELMMEIDRLQKLEPHVRMVQEELDKRRNIDYQKQLLEEGGYKAVKENEAQIRTLEKRLKKLIKSNKSAEQEAQELKQETQENAPEEPEIIPESAAEYDRLKKQGEITLKPTQQKAQAAEIAREPVAEQTEEYIPESAAEYGQMKRQGKTKAPKITKPVSKSTAAIAKADLRKALLTAYSIPGGSRGEIGKMIDALADQYLKDKSISWNDREDLINKLWESGVMHMEADDGFQAVRELVNRGRIYVPEGVKHEFGDDWNSFRREAMSEGIYLVNDESAAGWDQWNAELSDAFPGLFPEDEYDPRSFLERVVDLARKGKGENLTLAEYAAKTGGVEYATAEDMMDNLERQADYALKAFAEKANLEIYLKDRTGVKIAQERQRMGELMDKAVARERERGDERVQAAKESGANALAKEKQREEDRSKKEREHRKEVAQRLRERQAMRELQQKTLKQLQWLSKNRNKFPGDLQGEVNKILEDIDIYAASVAEEMHIDPKTGKTWRELRDIYQEAKQNDPNFMPSEELQRIVARLDYKKIGDLDIGALNDLFKAAVGLRTELYNRNNMIEDELHSTFAEVYDAVKEEMQEAPGNYQTGVKGGVDAFLSDAQLTPMNRFQRMAGWNPNSRWYGMAKMLEKGEREQRRFRTEAARQIAPVLEQYADWARRADGQGKDAIWYEVKVPESWEYHMGDKPVFSDKTVTVYMTPAQKVHMYLESKNLDNLRHMEGGRTFADKELYSKGKRAEAFAQGKTVKLLPETVKNIVSDLTEEEQALANALEAFYNNYSKQEINRVSNILYGYDKAMGGYYAPIYTDNNYTKSEPGIFDLTAEGVGNLKSRVVSATPSLNIGAFDAFEKSVDRTGRFVGLSIPIRNLNTLINWRESEKSTKKILDDKWGEKTTQWVEDLMTELQDGKERSSSSIEALTNKVLSRYITAVFGANPSIVAKQFASHPLAATYLKWNNLINGLLHVGQADPELISKYTGELDYRMLGYATPETAQIKDNPGILQRKGPINFLFGGGAITWMDGFTVRTLWSAAEQKVSREQPDLEVGTQEQINAGQSPYYQAVAREFEEAVSRSQPMYDTMHRSNIMRETNPLVRPLTLFKTVPQQEYNMLRQAVGEAAYYKRTGADKETQAAARQKAGRAFAGVLIGNLMIGLVTFLNALWKNKGKKYRDENGNLATGKVIEELGKQYFKDTAGLAIGGDVAADLLSAILFGDKWYGLEMPGLEQLGSILEQSVNAGKTVKKLVADSIDILQNGGDWDQYMADHSAEYLKAVDQIVNTLVTYGTGLPLDNVKAYLLGGVQWISPQIKTAYDDLMKKADKSGLKGLKGASLETRTMHIFQDRAGDADASTVETIAGLYAAGYTDAVPSAIAGSYTINGETRSLNAAEEQLYRQVWRDSVSGALDDLTRDKVFRNMGQADQAKVLKKLYDYGAQNAKETVWPDYSPDKWVTTAKDLEAKDVPLSEWLPIQQELSKISGKNKKQDIKDYIDSLPYSRDQKKAMYTAAGYNDADEVNWHTGAYGSGKGKTYAPADLSWLERAPRQETTGLKLPSAPQARTPISSGLKLQSTPKAKPSTGGLKLR